MNEEETKLISSRRDKIEIPKGSFGYRFFEELRLKKVKKY